MIEAHKAMGPNFPGNQPRVLQIDVAVTKDAKSQSSAGLDVRPSKVETRRSFDENGVHRGRLCDPSEAGHCECRWRTEGACPSRRPLAPLLCDVQLKKPRPFSAAVGSPELKIRRLCLTPTGE
jgi:hypothetical protein